MAIFLPLPSILLIVEILGVLGLIAFNIFQVTIWQWAQEDSKRWNNKGSFVFLSIFTFSAIVLDFLAFTLLGWIVWVS